MNYPKLVRKEQCKTDIHVVLYGEGTTEDGEPVIALEDDFKCNYQDKAKRVLSAEKVVIQLTAKAYFIGDIAPDLAVISGGQVTVFGETRSIYQGSKARNPDGTVNFTELEIM
ncbi:MAG: hypothetical protein IJ220_08235 [Clostridia bacterium]|nr:hypothetical protein [Clostridia bacterium]